MPCPFIQTAGPDTQGQAHKARPHPGRRACLPLPEHLWCLSWGSATSQGPHPAESLPSPLSWQLQSASLFPESDYKGKHTHMEFSRIQSASSGTDSLRHCWPALFPCERKKGPRRAPGRGLALRLNKGASGAGCCDTGSKSYPVGVQDTESQPRPPLPPSTPGRPAKRRAGWSSVLASGSQWASTQCISEAEEEVWVRFLSNIFSKEQYLFWWNATSRYYLSFKDSKTLTQPERMSPHGALEPGIHPQEHSRSPSPLPPRIFAAFWGDSHLSRTPVCWLRGAPERSQWPWGEQPGSRKCSRPQTASLLPWALCATLSLREH